MRFAPAGVQLWELLTFVGMLSLCFFALAQVRDLSGARPPAPMWALCFPYCVAVALVPFVATDHLLAEEARFVRKDRVALGLAAIPGWVMVTLSAFGRVDVPDSASQEPVLPAAIFCLLPLLPVLAVILWIVMRKDPTRVRTAWSWAALGVPALQVLAMLGAFFLGRLIAG